MDGRDHVLPDDVQTLAEQEIGYADTAEEVFPEAMF